MLQAITACLIALSCFAVTMFLIALLIKRNDIADVVWGICFVICFVVGYKVSNNVPTLASYSVMLLTTIWAVRLSTHIWQRFKKSKSEDFRYKTWRDSWGKWFYIRSFLQVFLLQTWLAVVVSLPTLAILNYSKDVSLVFVVLGVWIWANGFIIEYLSDKQLAEFVKNKKNDEILQTGLWKYSRHPNYFGEITQWWGIFVIALGVPGAWWTILGPLTITFLITKVSGIPLLEKRMKNNPKYQEYAHKTSVLIPLPIKNN